MKNQNLFTIEEELLLDSIKKIFLENSYINTIFLELFKIQSENPNDSYLEDCIKSLKDKIITNKLSLLDLKELNNSFHIDIYESDLEERQEEMEWNTST